MSVKWHDQDPVKVSVARQLLGVARQVVGVARQLLGVARLVVYGCG